MGHLQAEQIWDFWPTKPDSLVEKSPRGLPTDLCFRGEVVFSRQSSCGSPGLRAVTDVWARVLWDFFFHTDLAFGALTEK